MGDTYFHQLTEAISRLAKAMAAALTVPISAEDDEFAEQTEPVETGAPLELLVESLEELASMGITICMIPIVLTMHVMTIGVRAEQPARISFRIHAARMHTAATGT